MLAGDSTMRAAFSAAACALLGSVAPAAAVAQTYPQPLATEAMPAVATLAPDYPKSWVFVHDLHFDSLPDGRVAVVDVAADGNAVKGQLPAAQFATMLAATARPDIYVGETFHARLTRGARTDVISIWDKATLAPKGEIVLPGGKRGQFVTLRNAMQFTNDEKWLLVFNFTPASSVTVVDLAARRVLGDIDLPGCSLVYPTGARGFTSLCADGTMTSVALTAQAKAGATVTGKPFNDIDTNPMFMTPAMVGRTAWFVTFRGTIRGIDLAGEAARDLGAFDLPREKTAAGEWRPSGWQVIASDPAGRLYVLMNPAGKEGSHKDGGTEVWVVDPKARARVARIALKRPAVSVEVTAQPQPLLVAAIPGGDLDVYDAASGALRRTIPKVAHDPMTMAAVR